MADNQENETAVDLKALDLASQVVEKSRPDASFQTKLVTDKETLDLETLKRLERLSNSLIELMLPLLMLRLKYPLIETLSCPS